MNFNTYEQQQGDNQAIQMNQINQMEYSQVGGVVFVPSTMTMFY